MPDITRDKKTRLKIRKMRIRKKVVGTADRPRLSVYRSLKHIYLQAIDDTRGKTIASLSTLSKELKEKLHNKTKTQKAKIVGESFAEKLKALGINKAVFDRNGRKYHGRIKTVAEGVRNGGINF